jgi:peptidyl-prolyl cis-trans isomerase D
MLRGLRTASSGWLGKTVMAAVVGFLIISFAIWGIGDIFRGFGRGTVAQVGHTEISMEQFRQLYNDRLQQLGRQLGRPITPDQARAFGLEQQLLGQIMAEAAIDERARQLGLGVSDAEIARRITEEPAFRGASGEFDRSRFEQTIRAAGYTEQRFVSEQRRDILRRQLAGAVSGDITPPRAAAEALDRFRNEQRTIEYVVLDAAQAGDIPAPSADELAKYFEARKILFRAPEYRKATILALLPDEIARNVEVSAEDVKTFYERNLSRFSTPEKREIQQIIFPNKEDAHKAAERMAAGLSFDDLAKERGISQKDLDLGLLAKSDLADRAVADAAFSLQAGQSSGAIDGAFGGTIVRVVKIEPGHTQPLSEVEAEIKHQLALERSKTEIRNLRDKLDEEIGGGARLDEAANKLNLPFRTIEAIDRSGRGPDGQVVQLPKGVDLVNGIFSTEVGIENDPLQTPDGGLVWYDLVAITPARDRPLDEVKDKVEARWHDDQVAARLKTKAAEMTEKMKGGATLESLASADKLKVETAKGLKRQGDAQGLPTSVVEAAFQTDKGEAGSAEGKTPTERVVFRVADVEVPKFDPASEDAKKLEDALRNVMTEELLNQYIARVASDLGTKVNQSALAQAIGAAANQ